ncbi:MAG: hypothetical protein ACYC7J_16560 [Syntrophales bacterium]
MMKPLTVEVVSNLITAFGVCSRCELVLNEAGATGRSTCCEDMADYPADLKEELVRLNDWLAELCRLYRHRISIRLIDAKSPLGLYKSLLHRIRRYPTFIIEKKSVYSGWDRGRIEELLDTHIRASNRQAER